VNRYLLYLVIAIIAFEILGWLRRLRAKKRLEKGGSKWDVERYIDLKKLILLIVIGAGLYIMFPYIKEQAEQNYSNASWLINRKLLFLAASFAGLLIVTELLYKLVLLRVFRNHELSGTIVRFIHWGIFIYLIAGLWPFGKEAYERFRNSVNQAYVPKTAAEKEKIESIKKARETIKQYKSEIAEEN